jgi:hypothetical protein
MPNEFFSTTYNKRVDVFSFGLVMYHFLTCIPHKWSKSTPGPDRKLILKHMNRIPLQFLKDLILLATNDNHANRRDIFYYKWLLRKYCSCAEKLFDMSHIKDDYAKSTTKQKDLILIQSSTSILKTVSGESNIEKELINIGISYSDLKSSRELNTEESLLHQIRTQVPQGTSTSQISLTEKTKVCTIQ